MSSRRLKTAVCFIVCVTAPAALRAAITMEYANAVIDFSSQFSSVSWSAAQATGAPNTFTYGDIVTAWAPLPRNGTLEYITVGFATPAYADGFTVRETDGNGFVYRVDVLDTSNVLHTVFSGVDPSLPLAPADFSVNFARTSYLVRGLKVYTDTNHDLTTWEEIDAIQLRGDSEVAGGGAVPEPTSIVLVGGILSLATSFAFQRKKRKA